MIGHAPARVRPDAARSCQLKHILSSLTSYGTSDAFVNRFAGPLPLSLTRCPELPPSAILWILWQRRRLRKPITHLLVRDEEV